MRETLTNNIEDLKEIIYEQIQQILFSDDLSEERKVEIFDEAYRILFE